VPGALGVSGAVHTTADPLGMGVNGAGLGGDVWVTLPKDIMMAHGGSEEGSDVEP